jgi:hypothetical protein
VACLIVDNLVTLNIGFFFIIIVKVVIGIVACLIIDDSVIEHWHF